GVPQACGRGRGTWCLMAKPHGDEGCASSAGALRSRTAPGLAGRRFGPGFVIPTLAAAETSDIAHYDGQPEARAGGLPAAERPHARLMRAIAGPQGMAGPPPALVGGRPPRGGRTLRGGPVRAPGRPR